MNPLRMPRMTARRWIEYTASILVGNAIYFLVLFPGLPARLQHQTPGVRDLIRIDAGLVVDFLCCVAVYAVIRLASAHARRWWV